MYRIRTTTLRYTTIARPPARPEQPHPSLPCDRHGHGCWWSVRHEPRALPPPLPDHPPRPPNSLGPWRTQIAEKRHGTWYSHSHPLRTPEHHLEHVGIPLDSIHRTKINTHAHSQQHHVSFSGNVGPSISVTEVANHHRPRACARGVRTAGPLSDPRG